LIAEPVANPPHWAALDYRQCSHCPLDKTEHPHCPIALQLHNIIEHFHDTSSIDEVELEVITEERHIKQNVHLQRAIGSMLGLVSPTCGCPKMAYMKPMARFHLPLSSEEETLFRVTGMYLLSQQLLGKSVTDFSGLKAIYDDLHILNKALATRLRGATESDSSKNAIALLDMYSNLVPMMIDDQLPELLQLFSAYQVATKPSVANKTPLSISELTLEPILTPEPIAIPHEPAVPATAAQAAKPARTKTADELALEALLEEVPADELAELLGTQKNVVVKNNEDSAQEKPRGRAVFKLADD